MPAQSSPPVLGLTGGIACGKSTVANWLADKGARIINADRLGHEVLEPDGEAYQTVRSAFGSEIVNPGGQIDRKVLGRIVFADAHALAELNALTHPHIFDRLKRQLAAIRADSAQSPPLIVIEAAILLEVGWEVLCDQIWTVETPPELALKRLMTRNQLDQKTAQQRIASQYPPQKRKEHAHRVLCNAADLDALSHTVAQYWQAWLTP